MAAGKGGGSWKVAYADFVTAMMAFFLVMWIGAQDQKTRQSVANYFVDPSGVAKKPARTGATFDSLTYGSLPANEKTNMNKGRESHSKPEEHGTATQRVSEWLHADPNRLRRWREQAQACREAAAKSPEANDKAAVADMLAARELSKQLRIALTAEAPKLDGVNQDLLLWSFEEVNWTELAEDLLAK